MLLQKTNFGIQIKSREIVNFVTPFKETSDFCYKKKKRGYEKKSENNIGKNLLEHPQTKIADVAGTKENRLSRENDPSFSAHLAMGAYFSSKTPYPHPCLQGRFYRTPVVVNYVRHFANTR